ncbi:MAG: hypothetical protein ABJO67_09610 [Pseudoruegeria sp.]
MGIRYKTLLSLLFFATSPVHVAAQSVCGNFQTNQEKTACQIGYDAGRADGGSEGMIAGLAENTFGSIVIAPKGTAGTEGYEILGVPGVGEFSAENHPSIQSFLEAYPLSESLSRTGEGMALSPAGAETALGAFRFSVEDGKIIGLETLERQQWQAAPLQ